MEEATGKDVERMKEKYHIQKISETLYQEGLITKAELLQMNALLNEEE